MGASPMEFISAKAASIIIGCNYKNVIRLAELGYIGTMQLPGAINQVRYHRADVERVARESIRPATVAGPTPPRHPVTSKRKKSRAAGPRA